MFRTPPTVDNKNTQWDRGKDNDENKQFDRGKEKNKKRATNNKQKKQQKHAQTKGQSNLDSFYKPTKNTKRKSKKKNKKEKQLQQKNNANSSNSSNASAQHAKARRGKHESLSAFHLRKVPSTTVDEGGAYGDVLTQNRHMSFAQDFTTLMDCLNVKIRIKA